jgi:hypothetical protein
MRILFAILFSLSLHAQPIGPNEFQRIPGRIECQEQLMRCTYISQNLTARTLAARVKAVLKPGDVLLPSEGYITIESTSVLSFWFYDENLRDRFEGLLPLLDVLEDGVPSHLVQLTTEIYSLSEEGLSHIDASVGSISSDPGDAPDFDILNNGGILDLSLTVSSRLLSAVLGTNVGRKETSRVTRVVQLVPNLAGINYERTTNIYVSPTAGVVKDEKAGLTLGGTVSINRGDSNLVLIKDYSFNYGVLTPGNGETEDRVTILRVSNPQLYLYEGVSTMIVSSNTSVVTRDTNVGILSFGRERSKVYNKLMVVTRAKTMTFDNYRDEMARFSRLSLFRTFSESQVDRLPESRSNIESVLNSLKPYTYRLSNGEPVIGFKLDEKLASKTNIKKTIEVEIRGGGIRMDKMRSVENLMLSGFKLDSLSSRYMNRAKVKLKVKFKVHNSRQRVSKTLYYDPDRNVFFE